MMRIALRRDNHDIVQLLQAEARATGFCPAISFCPGSSLEFSSMDKQKEQCCISFVLSLVVVVLFLCNNGWFAIARADQTGYISAVGDPGNLE
ncbi:hypothetical protein EZV62_026975 [Acer yangbiense]|uniref:Uncharacterized protein n=1 Tax=Acer yangbiense TaxID=1000413 RepID=A0A5C7GSF9_9ROSI|nr:hypothetical protein EZV62_026975 [Acer yangbiense]